MTGGDSVSFWAKMARAFGPVNGGSSVSVSYSTAASEYWSVRPSTSSSPADCSGLM